MQYWTLVLITVVLAAVIPKLLFKYQISWWEMVVQSLASLLLGLALYVCYVSWPSFDTAYVTGKVTKKYMDEVSCEHSYRCNCYTTCSGTGNNRSCTEHCSTCYEHSSDFDWVVESTVGDTRISRVDRRGTDEPPRFTKVEIGEPFTGSFVYSNPILAAPSSLFKGVDRKGGAGFPAVYDYYRYSPVIGGSNEQNKYVESKLISYPHNLVFYITSDPNDFHNIEARFVGGKVNSLVTVLTVKDDVVVKADAFTYGKSKWNTRLVTEVKLELTGKPMSNEVFDTTFELAKSFVQGNPEEFEYLNRSKELGWGMVSSLI